MEWPSIWVSKEDDNDNTDALPTGSSGDHTDARLASRGGTQHLPKMSHSEFVADCYNMNHDDRGTAIIINNKKFHPRTGMGERTGTDVDADAMHNLLDNVLGFERVLRYNDLSVRLMEDELRRVSKMDHSGSDCFVCVILTHGEEGYVFGVDNKVLIDSLVYHFKGQNCPSLAGKPKLFFIQACRGTELDGGVTVADAGGEEAMDQDIEIRRIPSEADFLMAYSVVPGFYAWRNSSKGSWFIQAVVDVFSKNWKTMDVLTMMTRVNKKVAYDFESNASQEYMTRKKQIPCITSMLTKDVIFTKK